MNKTILISLLLFPLLLAAAFFGLLVYGTCTEELHAEFLSPDARHKAVVFNKNCGATTDVNTQVSVLAGDEGMDFSRGNTLVINASYQHNPVQVNWHNNTALELQFPEGKQVYHQNTQPVDGISVSFLPTIPKASAI